MASNITPGRDEREDSLGNLAVRPGSAPGANEVGTPGIDDLVPDSVLRSPKERAPRHLRLVLRTAVQARAIKTAKIGQNPVIVNFV
jgi:hypothetical protein